MFKKYLFEIYSESEVSNKVGLLDKVLSHVGDVGNDANNFIHVRQDMVRNKVQNLKWNKNQTLFLCCT